MKFVPAAQIRANEGRRMKKQSLQKQLTAQLEDANHEINRLRMELQHALLQDPPQAETDVLMAAEDFVQKWIMHPRDPELVGPAHAELIRCVLNQRHAVKAERRGERMRSFIEGVAAFAFLLVLAAGCTILLGLWCGVVIRAAMWVL